MSKEKCTGIKTVNDSKFSIPVEFEKIAEYTQDDKRFTKVRITLMHTGLNANQSIFNKDVVEEAIHSLAYIPILGFIEKNSSGEEDFSNHKYILLKDENGLKREYIGAAYGVILSEDENNAHFEIKDDGTGTEREYLVVDGIMWNFLKGSKIMNRDVIKDHSMEIYDDGEDSYDGYEDDDGNFVFEKFSFRGACILGNDSKYQPAMVGSNIEVMFTVSDFVKEIQSELNNKYSEFTRIVEEQFDVEDSKDDFTNDCFEDNSCGQENIKEGGNVTMATDFTQTVMQQFSDVAKAVAEYATTKDFWGDYVPRYYAVDIQDAEVIVVDREENYQYYGFAFTMDGDKPVIDFESVKRKKITYADYIEGEVPVEGAFDFGTHISKIEETAFSKVSEADEKVKEADERVTKAEEDKATAESNFTSLQEKYDEIKPKYEEYVKAENERIEAENKENKDKLIEQYEVYLKDDEKFVELKEKVNDYSIEELETKCAVMFARKNMATNFSAGGKNNSTVLGVDSGDDDTPDGYVVQTKYGLIRIKR